ncbi:MAG: T9SS type A sorting domain-containing protein [Bacteroidota bacterium]
MLALFATASTLVAQVVVTDASINAGETVTWTADNEYLLDGFVFVEEGATLNIEAGTVIKGKEIPSNTDLASTLIITRDATINAIGTSDAPIIFTSELDDVTAAGDLTPQDRGLWGGLILLGNATIVSDGQEEEIVEGLPVDDNRSLYGGTDDADNSGRLSFISIRHGGAELAPGEEINGLTLAGIGSGTQVDHVEVYSNSDDGIEFFGGTVDVTYAAVSFCGDDAFDWDLGYRGRGQYWFSIIGEDDGDNNAEMDGAKPDAGTPSSNPLILNATYIGAGANATAKNEHALLFRDGTRGAYANSIFTDGTNFGLQIEDVDSGIDSYQYYQDGALQLMNNIFWSFGQDLIQGTAAATPAIAAQLITDNNVQADPQLRSISRTTDGGFDPRPSEDGPAYDQNALAAFPNDDFFTTSFFKGAFCDDGVWIQKWTALAQNNVLGADVPFSGNAGCDVTSVEDFVSVDNGFVLTQNYPNPVVTTTDIFFSLPEAATISLEIFTVDGQLAASIYDNERLIAGDHNVTYDASKLPQGFYYYSLKSGDLTITRSMMKR